MSSSDIKIFDPSIIESVTNFTAELMTMDSSMRNDQFLITNAKIAIEALQKMSDNQFDDYTAKELITLIANLAFFSSSNAVMESFVKCGLHSVYARMIDYYLKQSLLAYLSLGSIFGTLSSLTYSSEQISNENVRHNLIQKSIDIISNNNFLVEDKLNNDDALMLYDQISAFLCLNSTYKEAKEVLLKLGIVGILCEHITKLDDFLESRKELKIVKVNLISALAFVLNDEELQNLPISKHTVSTFIDVLKEIVENSKSVEQEMNNTKFYINYKMANSNLCVFASKILSRLIRICVNDAIKQNMHDSNALPLLQEILQNGNDEEKEKCYELMGSLCFNDSICKSIKENEVLMKLIKETSEKSTNASNKRTCQQIIQMVNQILQQRISSAKVNKTDGHIMISYNHQYKELCTAINEELKKKGYKTWMDIDTEYPNLHDAVAKAVETASVVLVCYSYEYKASSNCRLEAQYAAKRNKSLIGVKLQHNYEPDGWLKIVLTTKPNFDFSSKDNEKLQNAYANLFKQIDLMLGKTPVEQSQNRPPSRRITSAKT